MEGGYVALLLGVLGLSAVANAGEPLHINRNLLDAMQQVESGGNGCKIGDHGRSFGAYQIMRGYYNDAVEFNPRLRDGGRTFEDVVGRGGIAYSEQVIMSYMGRYATRQRLGHDPTCEDIARIHNGGPNGYKRDSTNGYWKRVKQHYKQRLGDEGCSNGFKRTGRAAEDVNTCEPACNDGECCSSAGICNCLSNTTFVPCDNSVNGSGSGEALRYGAATAVLSILAGFFLTV